MILSSDRKKHLHFVGIGGIGMSALAQVFHKKGFSVSGSDSSKNCITSHLEENGIKIFKTQNSSNIFDITKNLDKDPIIIYSSAIHENNDELRISKLLKLKIIHRADLLQILIKKHNSICVSGTHGKTTTSTYIATLLTLCQKDPTALIGGIVPLFKSNSRIGKSNLVVAEADESDGTITKLKSKITLITNIELDHTNHYPNISKLIKTMQEFSSESENLIANYDCDNLRNNFSANAWWSNKKISKVKYSVILKYQDGNNIIAKYFENSIYITDISIPVAGMHNLSNVTGAISACREIGIPIGIICDNLKYLKSPKRRFEIKGYLNNRLFIDDYAHHPTEVKATLCHAKSLIMNKNNSLKINPKRIITIFQPHRYSRTADLFNDFSKSFNDTNILILAPIYSAGERPIKEINIENLAINIKKYNPKIIIKTAKNFNQIIKLIDITTNNDDLVITMGAGNINKIWNILNDNIQTKLFLQAA